MYFHAVLQGKRATIGTYFQEILESIDSIIDSDIPDHTITKLLPVVTTVRAHLELQTVQKPGNFDLAFKFAPARKNETQMRFEKVKSKSNKAKFPEVSYIYMYTVHSSLIIKYPHNNCTDIPVRKSRIWCKRFWKKKRYVMLSYCVVLRHDLIGYHHACTHKAIVRAPLLSACQRRGNRIP